MRSLIHCLAVFLTATLCGCRSHDDPHVARLAPWHSSGANPRQQIVATNTRFGFNVLHDLIAQQPGKNIIISPVSLGLALAMTYNGTGTTTRDAIGKTLQVDGLPIDQVNSEYQALSRDIRRADRQVEVDIANSLWLKQGCSFGPQFLNVCRQSNDAEASTVDFKAPDAAPTINAWASKHTGGHIPEMVSPAYLRDKDPVALLMSAAYFSGKWTTPFTQGMTKPVSFTLANGSSRDVPMMPQRGEYLYLETADLQAISLPYESGRLSFYVFLPKAPSNLKALCAALTADQWQKCLAQLAPHPGLLNLPRFLVQGELPLDDTLRRLGMTDAFAEGRADFTPMSPAGGIWLDGVRQRTYLHVYEKGTEAAAIAVMPPVGGMIMPEPDQFSMIVDHPFLCAICDNATGAVLFMGAISEPGDDAAPRIPAR